MHTRLKQIRKAFNLTQQEFANRLKIKRNTVATYETGKSNPSDAAISLICREFNVREEWLRTGEGKMFKDVPSSTLEALAKEYGLSDAAYVMVEKFISLKPENQKIIFNYVQEVAAAFQSVETSPAADAQSAAPQMTVDEAEAKYIKSTSRNARKEVSVALNTTGGTGNEAAKQ